jgi:hypothetical protein
MEALRLAALFYQMRSERRTEISISALFVCCSFARCLRASAVHRTERPLALGLM